MLAVGSCHDSGHNLEILNIVLAEIAAVRLTICKEHFIGKKI